MKDHFVSTAAHELRTPLTSIRGFSEILLTRDLPPDRITRYLTHINEQSVHLTNIIDDLLNISRLEAGEGLDLTLEPVNVDELIAKVLQPFADAYEDHTFDHQPLDEPALIEADAGRLTQVIQNIVSNAVKYSPEGGPVTVTTTRQHDFVSISVQDEGLGMAEDEQHRIFNKFYRVDTSNSAVGGTGLGLTIARLIVELHGGGIHVESTLGEGSTFTVTLPRTQRDNIGPGYP